MQRKKYITNRIMRCEEQSSKHINILAHYDDETLLDKSGKLIQIFKLAGLDFITKDEQSLDNFKNRRNNLFKSFSSDFAVYCWQIRRKVSVYPEGHFYPGFAKEVNDKYLQKIKSSEMYGNELYLAVMTKQPEGIINKSFSLLNQFSHSIDKEAKQAYLIKRHKELHDVARKVLSALSEYRCELLSVYEKKRS